MVRPVQRGVLGQRCGSFDHIGSTCATGLKVVAPMLLAFMACQLAKAASAEPSIAEL